MFATMQTGRMGLVSSDVGGPFSPSQTGPTLDLVFVGGPITDPLAATATQDQSIDLSFTGQTYQIAAQYVVWETGVGLVDKTFSQIITFTRASGATWFNSAGNLIGVDFSVTSNTIGTGSKTFTLDATAGVNRSWATGDSVLISDQSNSANNMTGTVTSYTASTQTLVVNVTSTGGSGTIASWRIGSTMPRFDYNPATLAARGLLIEEARTNLRTYSEAIVLSNGYGTSSATLTAVTITTPMGTAASTLVLNAGANTGNNNDGFSFGSGLILTNSTAYAQSVFAKSFGSNVLRLRSNVTGLVVSFTLTGDGAAPAANTDLTSASIQNVGNGWYRCSWTFTTTTTAPGNRGDYWTIKTDVADGVNGIYVAGAQLEAGAFSTSYIPTTTTALTRSADEASVNTLNPWYNQTEGTVYAELQSLSPLNAAQSVALGKYPHVWHIEAGANDSNVFWYGIGVEMYIAGTYNGIGVVPTGINKFAASLAASGGQSRSSLNGAAAVNRNGTLTGTATGFFLGRDSTAGLNNFLNGWLRRLTYYPRALSAAELQAITT